MKLSLLFILFTISFAGCNQEPSPYEKMAKVISGPYHSGGYVPLVSELNPGLKINEAYEIQKHFVRTILNNDDIAGYKTGLASKKAQSNYFVDNPISGVLFKSGEYNDNSEIKFTEYFTMLVETELGFRIGEEINKPINNVKELDSKISAIIPVIELPDVRFTEFKNSKLTDVVAANICSSKFVKGKESDFKKSGSQDIDIQLKLDGNTINTVSIADSMEYQKELLIWLINQQLENGWEIKPGQILITGAMGKINIGRPGLYEADYGQLGKVKFKVR